MYSHLPKAQAIAEEVRRRIVERSWRQGERIPDESALAVEFGASRATVHKALRLLADEGLLSRRRRAGTRVALDPAQRAVVTIPIVREQVEHAGMRYGHRVVACLRCPAPAEITRQLDLTDGAELVHMRAVHYGNGRPFQFEDRWINTDTVPHLEGVDFRFLNANEWLVRNAPYLRVEMTFSAENATARDARMLDVRAGTALLILHRATWNDLGPITTVRVAFRPGHRVATAGGAVPPQAQGPTGRRTAG